jgi:hypothetical protein
MFNWRLVFDFEYLPTEDVIVVRKKSNLFTRDRNKEVVKLPPILSVQARLSAALCYIVLYS